MKLIPLTQAVDQIPDGSDVVASPACATPTSLLGALTERAEGRGMTLLSGLIFDPSVILGSVGRAGLGWRTWHPTAACQPYLEAGRMEYVPLRASQVPGLLRRRRGAVALVRVSPPDRHGWCSLGPSGSYVVAALETSRFRIAEIDPTMPRTWGTSRVHISQLDVLCDSMTPMPAYEGTVADETSRSIAGHLIDVLPERPLLQLGIGRIPEAFVSELATRKIGPLRFTGMGCDGMVDVAANDLLDMTSDGVPVITSPDLLGTKKLMDFADDNPSVAVYPSTVAHSVRWLGSQERLVSINTAVQVDLSGQVNAELVNGKQISGIGGSLDFVEAAMQSQGGQRVIAVSSTRIVLELGSGSAVTAPCSATDIVVTERGVARLEGLSVRERSEALRAIASL